MARFRKKPKPEKLVEIEAFRWFKNGDHPKDDCHEVIEDSWPCLSEGKVVKRFIRSDIYDGDYCTFCGGKLSDHGWLENDDGGIQVCPGEWIIKTADGKLNICGNDEIERDYELIED